MQRVVLAAMFTVLATTAHADFRTELVEVIAQVGAKTVTVLIEKRAQISGTLVLNVIGSAIYDKGKELAHGSGPTENLPRAPNDAAGHLLTDCAEGKHNLFCPKNSALEDELLRRSHAADEKLNAILDKQNVLLSDGNISKPAMSDALNTWLTTSSGQKFVRAGSKIDSLDLTVRFIGKIPRRPVNSSDGLQRPSYVNPLATKPQ